MNIVQFWDIAVQFEYDRRKITKGLEKFLRKHKKKHMLDCACGTGFVTLDLIKKGYKITCSDRSTYMLRTFQKNARKMKIRVKPYHLQWSQLSKKFKNKFAVVLCRGSSLIYGGSWDRPQKIKKKIIGNALENFYQCLKPNGILYVDTTAEKNFTSTEPKIIRYPYKFINGVKVKFIDKITLNKRKKLRIWEPTIFYNGKRYSLKRYSYFLPHRQLAHLLKQCGFVNIHKQKIGGEHYDVFIAQKV